MLIGDSRVFSYFAGLLVDFAKAFDKEIYWTLCRHKIYKRAKLRATKSLQSAIHLWRNEYVELKLAVCPSLHSRVRIKDV